MKRCPECLFIYPESDARCDFDNTPLVVVDDAEIESATTNAAPAAAPVEKKRSSTSKKRSPGANSSNGTSPDRNSAGSNLPGVKSADDNSRGTKKSSRKKGTAITAAVGLAFGLGGFSVYYGLRSRVDEVAEIPPVATVRVVALATPLATPPPVETVSSSSVENAAPSPPLAKTTTERTATSHSRTTVAPVSTSGPGMAKGVKPMILLTGGGKIDADEVWRTRDGIWYRRAGIVTLLKHNRVKAIVNQ